MPNTPNLGLRKIDSKTEKFNQTLNYEENFDKIDLHAGEVIAQLADKVSKNLITGNPNALNRWTYTGIPGQAITIASTNTRVHYDKISCVANTAYTFCNYNSNYKYAIIETDINNIITRNTSWIAGDVLTFKTLPTSAYLCVSVKRTDESNVFVSDFVDLKAKLEIGNNATELEEFDRTSNLTSHFDSPSFVRGTGHYFNVLASSTRVISRIIKVKPNTEYLVKCSSPNYKFATHEFSRVPNSLVDSGWKVGSWKLKTAPTTELLSLIIAKYPAEATFELSEVDGFKIEMYENPEPISGDKQRFYNENKLRFIAHRGYSSIAPENTIPAFEEAGKAGFWGCETDIIKTLDNVFVCMHDETVDRTTNGTGITSSMTYAQIADLTVDSGLNISNYPNLKVPTLREYLNACKRYGLVPVLDIPRITLYQDLELLISEIKKEGFEDYVILQHSTIDATKMIRMISKKIAINFIATTLTDTNIRDIMGLGNAGVGFNYTGGYTIDYINTIHEFGSVATVFTVDNASIKNDLIAMGIDNIITNVFFD